MTDKAHFDASDIMAGLTGFQRQTVDHVMRRFHDPARPSRRFLVADETGLGKSIVARGVIARTIERIDRDPAVNRTDILYICSNSDLANQNLKRLNILGAQATPFASRLTLLARHSRRLKPSVDPGRTAVNLVSFTPGTSFSKGFRGGNAEERALLSLLLWDILVGLGHEGSRRRKTALHLILRGGVRSVERFRGYIGELAWELSEHGGADPSIVHDFTRRVQVPDERTGVSLLDRVVTLMDLTEGRRKHLPTGIGDEAWQLIGDLRSALAESSVAVLKPDLIILDEFQRFRELMNPDTEAGELAHHLFDHSSARVLLLSATPYKPFTYGEEEEDHARDFHQLLDFLAGRTDPVIDVRKTRELLGAYRESVTRGDVDADVRELLSSNLRTVMSRWERPRIGIEAMAAERVRVADKIDPEDLAGFVRLRRLADLVAAEWDRGLVTPEYWKSAPYFASFCQGYRLATRIKESSELGLGGALSVAMSAVPSLSGEVVATRSPLAPGNPRMNNLVEDTLDQGWWQLLWVPPSLPYLEPGGAYAHDSVQGMTKRLLFSSWMATPSAVASILSYEAERRITEQALTAGQEETQGRARLTYPVRADRPQRMSTLLIMWPHRHLARLGDLRTAVRAAGGHPLHQEAAVASVRTALQREYGSGSQPTDDVEHTEDASMRASTWRVAFSDVRNWAPDTDPSAHEALSGDTARVARALAGHKEERTDDEEFRLREVGGRELHVREAFTALREGSQSASDDDLDILARVALFAPGCVSFRVVDRLVAAAETAHVSESGVQVAAAALACGLRTLFNRAHVQRLLDASPDVGRYWNQVMQHIADGNLEAVLDEWVFHLWTDRGSPLLDDEKLLDLMQSAQFALRLREINYQAADVSDGMLPIRLAGAFALRYGGRTQIDGDARQPEVRAAFNSPFWPFVLASTSVGQEGIDFHWWCHAVFHWNTPANPVDFEQREGRVDRYRGHAVRKNIATKHGQAMLAGDSANPWTAAYDLACEHQEEYGDFTPNWVYPGEAKIERHLAPIQFSSDQVRYDRIKRDVSLYRLAIGQPRQEDFIAGLRNRGAGIHDVAAARLDLWPPS